MRKCVLLLSALLLATMVFPMAAFAYGHCGGGNARARYAPCDVEACSEAYAHRHGCAWYSGDTVADCLGGRGLCGISNDHSDCFFGRRSESRHR